MLVVTCNHLVKPTGKLLIVFFVTDGTNGNIEVMGYCDADWAEDMDECKSTSGYMIKVNGNVVSWQTKKQSTVALSSAE